VNPLRRQITDLQVHKLLQVLQLIRELEPTKAKVNELPIQTLTCLMYIASHDGCHKQAMEEDLNMNKAAGSRNTDWLARLHRLGRPGLNLITKEVDYFDKRRSVLKLTRKGKDLVHKITRILYDN
jgi:DNA-binding MarR family transcriptional regulator